MRFAETEREAKRFAAKREDGVTDDDLRWWWGIPDLKRRMIVLVDDNTRIASFMAKRETGVSAEEAAAGVRKAMPNYGDPTDTEHATGDDRPLPFELKDRVNKWVETKVVLGDQDTFRERLAEFSSFNALIRSEIRASNL